MRCTVHWLLIVVLSPVWLLLGGPVLPTPGRQPPPADPDEPPVVLKLRAIVKANPLEPAKEDDDLRKLLKARYNVAVRGLQARLQEFEAGRSTVEALFAAFRNVHDSQLELCEKPADQIGTRELYFELAKVVEKIVEAQFEAKRIGAGALEDARYVRLDAEIQLLKAKRQARPPQPR
jgi:hypothetical protein